ncbi:hypothetical protein SAY86_024604 [Trapa natans]|uniref:CTLH/CRA C-terminal to LisH motif domain-containing protein n=1 Tax=Trapa natans TaxID=22666 RepID=A0AAN7M5G4_TRANT|nr:hypothetical protein SAY86_024604 [Trapa natans]
MLEPSRRSRAPIPLASVPGNPSRGRPKALQYAVTYLAPLDADHLSEIQKIMGCLLFPGKLDQSPYVDLLHALNREKAHRRSHRTVVQSLRAIHRLTIAECSQVPTLKFITGVLRKKQDWQTQKELPILVELDDKLQFHSIFVCPVLKEPATQYNPLILHV